MADLFDTPLRAAALGVLIVATGTLILSFDSARQRFRRYTLVLVALALGMVLISEGVR